MPVKLTTEQYISNAKRCHGDVYDYSATNYKSGRDFVEIRCRIHGPFQQRAYCHTLRKNPQGCPSCSHNRPLSLEEVRTRSFNCHGDRYEIHSFRGIKNPLELSCKDHGRFTMKIAEVHWYSKDGGCPKCLMITRMNNLKTGNHSVGEKKWLDSLDVPIRQHRIHLGDQVIVVDGYDPETNTVYEFYGTYWHGHPDYFNTEAIHPTLGVSFGELHTKTLLREKKLKDFGYNIVSKWAHS